MDLTPEGVRGAKFRTQAMRGYNCDDVNAFVEQMAAGLAELLEQVTTFSSRATRAEREVEDLEITEAALRQTLGHAQSTADEILHAAKTEANRLVHEAQQRRASVLAEAETFAGRSDTTIDGDVRAEVERLHDARQVLQADIDVLAQHLASECQRARTMLEDALSSLARAPVAAPQPRLHDVRLPELPPLVESPWMTAVFGARSGLAAASAPPGGLGAADIAGPPDLVGQLGPPLDAAGIAPPPGPAVAEDVVGPETDAAWLPASPWQPVPETPEAGAAQPSLPPAVAESQLRETEAPAVPAATDNGAVQAPEPTGTRVIGGNLSDDDFLAELRLAALSTEPLGPAPPDDPARESGPHDEFEQEVTGPGRRGGRLRRRR